MTPPNSLAGKKLTVFYGQLFLSSETGGGKICSKENKRRNVINRGLTPLLLCCCHCVRLMEMGRKVPTRKS